MAEDMEKYNDDIRPACKYGENCYQRNPDHIKKYKHPINTDDSKVKSPFNNKRTSDMEKRVNKNPLSPYKKKARLSIEEHQYTSSPKPINSKAASPESKEASSFHVVSDDVKKIIREKFLVEMPDDFYSFWEFSRSLSKNGEAKESFKSVNLFLVGPFDVLAGDLPERDNDEDYLLHWRYFYDPPEFQTILMSRDATGYHLGYFRDSPSDLPCFVASNEAEKNCKITPVADNIFGAVLIYLEAAKKKSPFLSISCQKLMTHLKDWATKHNISLEKTSTRMTQRKIKVVSTTFHGAGIVVPVDKKTQVGYRPLVETDSKIKLYIQNVLDCANDKDREDALGCLQPVITYANIATDECDFGSGLELGINFFSTGEAIFHNTAKQLLSIAYNMLNRTEFEKILNVHLNNRRKGSKLSGADL